MTDQLSLESWLLVQGLITLNVLVACAVCVYAVKRKIRKIKSRLRESFQAFHVNLLQSESKNPSRRFGCNKKPQGEVSDLQAAGCVSDDPCSDSPCSCVDGCCDDAVDTRPGDEAQGKGGV